MIQLKLPNGITGTQEDEEEEIIVTVHPEDKPPIRIKKHELIRWSKDLERELQSGKLSLSDGFNENWDEVNDCIALLRGEEVEVTFNNVKV